MVAGYKTGGRQKGSKNKPKPSIQVDTPVEAVVATTGGGGAPPGGILLPTRTRARETTDLAFPKYRTVAVNSLIPYVNNARTHSTAQVAKIAASIKEFGFTNPVLTDGKRGVIAGHGRLLAAQMLEMETVPTIELSHLSKAQRRAYVLADNRLALDAGWDDELLALELGELRDDGFDLSLTGFDAGELATLFGDEESAGLTDPDDVPAPPAVPVSLLGDVWLCGKHRVMAGDSTDVDHVAALMVGQKAALCLTDPPYGLGDTKSAKNDYLRYADTLDNLTAIIASVLPLAQANATCVVLTPGTTNHRLYPAPTWTMAWFVPAGTGVGPWGFCCWQPILCYGKDPKLAKGMGSHPDAVVHTERAKDFGHPCTKPINFWSWLMERASATDELVLDLFLGSGTGVIAAETTGRRCFGMEIAPEYVDVAVKRWQAFTGQQATLESTGRTFAETKASRLHPKPVAQPKAGVRSPRAKAAA